MDEDVSGLLPVVRTTLLALDDFSQTTGLQQSPVSRSE